MVEATESKPFVLAFDTANETVAVGLGCLDATTKTVMPITWATEQVHRASNTRLLPLVKNLLDNNGVQSSEIACVAVGRGPGSFTGVRIAVATAQGIASALSCGLIGLPTLDIVAEHAYMQGIRGNLVVIADAMRKEVYLAHYALTTEAPNRLDRDCVMKVPKAVEWIQGVVSTNQYSHVDEITCQSNHLLLSGDGLVKYAEQFASCGTMLDEALWTPTGDSLLATLQAHWRKKKCDPFDPYQHDPARVLPLYLRLSDAEENERARLLLTEPKNLKTGVQDTKPFHKTHSLDVFISTPSAPDASPSADVFSSDTSSSADISSSDASSSADIPTPTNRPSGTSLSDAYPPKAVIHPLIFAIESSCDETAAALIDGTGMLLADVVASQVDFHARFGGVVPEIASRKHIEAICGVCDECFARASRHLSVQSLGWNDIDAISVTYAPGLVGALVVGMAFAKGVAWAQDIPLIGVNHLEGHLYANKLGASDLKPPLVASLVSGGNTLLVHVKDWGDYTTLGTTIDDAVGEAFDKVSKALGLGYPGGPIISRYAEKGDPYAIDFPRAMLHSGDLQFSLSGLKTAVVSFIAHERDAGRALNISDIAASFQQAVIDVQVAKAMTAIEQTGVSTFCLGGGVAANSALRNAYEKECAQRGVRLVLPPLRSCGDNAGMIALVALDRYKQQKFFTLDADVSARSNLDEPY